MGMPIIEGSNTTKIQALTDILVSISLEEAAIAHILNAEGEKIQRIVRDRLSTTEEMLHVNKSVDNIADTLTNLVMLLKSKMRLVLNDKCFADFCDDPCADFVFILTPEEGDTLTQVGPNEYDLLAATSPAIVTVTTSPSVPVTIAIVSEVGVDASVLLNQIIITQAGLTFEGTVTATLTLPNGCTRTVVINVNQEPTPPCEGVTLTAEAAIGGGSLTQLGGDNHYQWTLVRTGTGNVVTISTDNILVPVTDITEVINTVTGGTVTLGVDTITITKEEDDVAAGLLVVAVSYGVDCVALFRFNVQTPEV